MNSLELFDEMTRVGQISMPEENTQQRLVFRVKPVPGDSMHRASG